MNSSAARPRLHAGDHPPKIPVGRSPSIRSLDQKPNSYAYVDEQNAARIGDGHHNNPTRGTSARGEAGRLSWWILRQRSEENSILLANSRAGPRGPLYNPTTPLVDGWAPLMMAPTPISRDALLLFTAAECITSAANLGLPLLPATTPVVERRRQIANRIGVTIDA